MIKINWDKILDDFAHKCGDGGPDMTNPNHLALLRESLLKSNTDFNDYQFATNEFVGELREDKPGVFMGYTNKNKKRYFPDAGKLKAAIDRGSVTAAPNSGGGAAAGVKPKKKKKKVAKHTASKGGGGKPAQAKSINQKIDFTKKPPRIMKEKIKPNLKSFKQRIKNGDIKKDSYKNKTIQVNGKTYNQPLTLKDIKKFFPSPPHKIPEKYITALLRILNTQKTSSNNPKISEFILPSGAGQISAQAAELLTLMTTSMGDKEADEFFAVLRETSGNRNGKEIIDPDWMDAAEASRRTILRQVRQKYGPNATIESAAWDNKNEVQDVIGLPYGDKGFSTDVYFRVKTFDSQGKPTGSVSHEVSLKKDLATFFANPGSTGIEDKFPDKPSQDSDRASLITENSRKRSEARLNKIKQSDIDTLTNKTDAQLVTTLENLPDNMRRLCLSGSPPNYKLSKETKIHIEFYKRLKAKGYTFPLSEKDLNDPAVADIARASGISSENWGKSSVNTKGANKLAVFTAYMQYAEELAAATPPGSDPKGPARQFLNEQVGIDDPPPAGSSRAVANLHIKKLGAKGNRAVLLELIKEKFPLKALLSGEETMALSSNSLDRKTCIAIFGTADYSKISQEIKIKKDPKTGDYYMSYTAKATGEVIKIGVVTCRQRGLGYASLTTEIAPTDEFRHRTYCANEQAVQADHKKTGGQYTRTEKNLNKRLTKIYGPCNPKPKY